MSKTISLMLTAAKYKPFVSLTAEELVFGYDDTLVSLAHKFYPRNKRPMEKMGLLNGVSFNDFMRIADTASRDLEPTMQLQFLFIEFPRHRWVIFSTKR